MKFKQIIIFLMAISILAIPLFILAQEWPSETRFIPAYKSQTGWRGLVPCGGTDEPDCTLPCLYVLIHNIINFLLWSIATPLAATA
jgi:hypothetical protein